MGDSCDFTKPISHENEMDRGLSIYLDSHRAVARYTLILKENFTQKARFMILQYGMDYESADRERIRLNALRPETGFNVPVYAAILENQDEARLAVNVAADKYWADQYARNEQSLAA